MKTADSGEQARLLRNWKAERDSSALYASLAQLERDPRLRAVYLELSGSERRHADFWEVRLRALGCPVPAFRPSGRIRVLILLARHLGIGFIAPSVLAREMKERDDYAGQEDALSAGLVSEEQILDLAVQLEKARGVFPHPPDN